ncbi:uncharacterized protein LOC108033370 [Drosophila biarmipes]|uniref:uncharacterized protein LOC108033370 n=1 Tax=Drosophila biarmipes TaxID=125945 RepID=UPI0007E7F665|nr:uncharacterized protein LOC108033370 [Drosophila biarmipes]
MLSLRSGIFAGSLLGSGSCFQRLAPCACRSSRKPSPKKSPKNPLKLQPDNTSEEQKRLSALTEMGCRCRPRSPKERWFFTNQRIILALAIALKRPPDLVSEFLHSLTLQNFARIIKPPDTTGASCKVPYVNCYACDNFMRIFDIHGNLRSRYNKDSLKLLLRLVQAVLRQDSYRGPEPLDTSFGAHRGTFVRDSIARRAGIDRDSIARQNGKRRLRNSEARATINRTNFTIGQEEPTIGDPGYVFGSSLDFSDWVDPMYTPEDWSFDDSLTSERFKRLENLLIHLNEKTYLTRDSDHLITAIRDLKLGRTVTNPPQYSNDKKIAKRISDSYYERVKASASRTLFKKRSSHHIRKRKKDPEEDSTSQKAYSNKLYYGAPLPVLIHEPFDREKPWTWLRRHPHQKRLDDTGRVTQGSIRRYRRTTIEQLMQKAKERSSVITVISTDSDSTEKKPKTQPMFGIKMARR